MYNGQTKFVNRRIVVNRRTGVIKPQLSGLGISPGEAAYNAAQTTSTPGYQSPGWPQDDLSEVAVNARFVPVPPPYQPPYEYDDMPEIVVSGTRIPWWVWGIGGALALTALTFFARRK